MEYWDNSLGLNLKPQFFAAQAVRSHMQELGGGSIINFSSIAWRGGADNMPVYATAKSATHGLTRALINNMVVGASKGYEKKLKIEGVGYQAVAKAGTVNGKSVNGVELMVGFANRPLHLPPDGIAVAVPDPTTIVVSGADKQKVGQFAAEIRASKKPEPYKGKGVRYDNEVVRRKEGKSFSAGK